MYSNLSQFKLLILLLIHVSWYQFVILYCSFSMTSSKGKLFHLLIQTTEQVWDNLEKIPIKTAIFAHFLWYLHQGRSVKSMNRTVAFDYKPWQYLGEKLHFRSYNVLHIHLISLWFPSICHSSKGPWTLYCRLSIVANHLREVPKGSHHWTLSLNSCSRTKTPWDFRIARTCQYPAQGNCSLISVPIPSSSSSESSE